MDITQWVIELRRDFHRFPEASWQEKRTSAKVEEILKSLGIETRRIAETAVVGTLRGGRPGKTIALRADMDALQVTERTGLPFASEVPGMMHGCGHDAHTASLLGAANILAADRAHLNGNVVFLFQPAEEVATGAEKMIEGGALSGVDAVMGTHVFGTLPFGKIGVVDGPVLAGFGLFKVTFKGKGGHGAMPHLGINTLTPACQAYLALQSIVSQETDQAQPLVITVGQLHGGTRFNVIADEAWFDGTTRYFDPALGNTLSERIKRIATATGEAHRCAVTVDYQGLLPPTINEPRMAALGRQVVRENLGDCLVDFPPQMASEDFSHFATKVPGVFFAIGAGDVSKEAMFANHHPQFDIDERCLGVSTQMYVSFAKSFLDNWK